VDKKPKLYFPILQTNVERLKRRKKKIEAISLMS
jgi:hypothetical protein